MAFVLTAASGTVAMAEETGAAGEPAADSAAKSPKEIYFELEKTFYVAKDVEPNKVKTAETRGKQIESKAEGYLTAGGPEKDAEIKTWAQKYIPEILTLADNYRAAAKEARFPDQTLTFKVQLMCDGYAEAYRALAKEDLATARQAMKRALEKRRDVRDSVFKR